jgi:hypothetical protein
VCDYLEHVKLNSLHIVWVECIKYIEKEGSFRKFGPFFVIWEIQSKCRVLRYLVPKTLDRELIINWDMDFSNFSHGEDPLVLGKNLSQKFHINS